MLAYNVRLALLSMRRNPIMTAVIVLGIALGIGTATLFSTMRHALARDPLPGKSRHLYYVRTDNWQPEKPYPGDDPNRPPPQLAYRDVLALLRSDIPVRQSVSFKSALPLSRTDRTLPRVELIRHCLADFFPMFEVPFRHGGPWNAAADAAPEQVVVLSAGLNDALFGGDNSVGRTILIDQREFRVVGVLAPWTPKFKYYDVTQDPYQPPEGAFTPLHLLRTMEIPPSGNSDGWGPSPANPSFEARLMGEFLFLQLIVELPDAARLERYREFLDDYVRDQKRLGRYPRPLNNWVTPLRAWHDEHRVVPPQVKAMQLLSLLFLGACATNLMGLLLGKFLARAPEVGVRRALGARRRDIFLQLVVECEVAALAGGAIGVLLALGGLLWLNSWAKVIVQRNALATTSSDPGAFFQLDLPMIGLAVLLSLAAGLVAGGYPAWRSCRIPPADYLKLQ